MTGADRLCDALLAQDIDVCFANPGTSEMHSWPRSTGGRRCAASWACSKAS